MAPPPAETLPEKVQLVTLSVPAAALKMAPPAVVALFPRKVEFMTVSALLLLTPPPLALVRPCAIVRLLRVSAPEEFVKMGFALPPSMVIVWMPPSISRVC